MAIGPTEVVTRKLVCDGCEKLRTERWTEYLENDETDSGTSARCALSSRNISAYWHTGDRAPDWCPTMAPDETQNAVQAAVGGLTQLAVE